MNKTITATRTGIAINYENGKSNFIPYNKEEVHNSSNTKRYFQMNEIQRNMYRRLMYGLASFTSEEISSLDQPTLFKIKNEHIRATDVVNELKYTKYYGAYNKLLAVIFPHVELDYRKDGKYAEMPTLRELKITTSDIVNAWINNKLLPLNFYCLNEETIKL
jgi:hypothetical protein